MNELKEGIQQEIMKIPLDMLHRAMETFTWKLQECVQNKDLMF